MPPDDTRYAIGDLAGLAGATARTIRYYVAQGLLPPPVGNGPGAHYTDDHLGRLRLIRRLQRQHQPLSDIRQRLASLGPTEIAALVADDAPEALPSNSALEYLRSVLGAPVNPPEATASLASRPVVPPPMRAPGAAPAFLRRMVAPPAGVSEVVLSYESAAAAASPALEPDADQGEQRSQWDRIGLTPNIEIHVRRPLGRLENRRVERLITIARQLLREEQP